MALLANIGIMQVNDLADRPICRNRNHDRRLVDQNIGNLRAVRVFNPGCPRFPALARFLHSEFGPRGDRNETAPRKVAEGAAFGHGEPGRVAVAQAAFVVCAVFLRRCALAKFQASII